MSGPDSAAEIKAAQFALDHYPDESSFWDSARGQELLGVIVDNNLTATTTAEFCRAWEANQLRAMADDEVSPW